MQNVKGTYDYYGKEQALRRGIQEKLREMFELYDFDEMETTIINELDFLTSKYSGGDEIIKEMYQFNDQRKRELGLRYDLTVPFAKAIALNPGIELPFRRYEMGKVFRDGPVKKGRLREFLQCDVDVVGIKGPGAEAELMQLAVDVFRSLDIPIVLKWNNRRFLGELLAAVGVPASESLSVMLTLDKLAKIGMDGVIGELAEKGMDAGVTEAIVNLIETNNPSPEALAIKYDISDGAGTLEVLALQTIIRSLGLEGTCVFDPFLSRGLSFYTGTVYEIFDATESYTSSLGGGGRYDAIIGQLVGREDEEYATVGLSFGMESIMALLENRTIQRAGASVVIIPVGVTAVEVLQTAALFRENGLRVKLDMSGRKLKNSLATISASGIRYVLLLGENEWKAGKVRLKDMDERTEHEVTLDEAVYILADRGGF